jgi:hypothetical protein
MINQSANTRDVCVRLSLFMILVNDGWFMFGYEGCCERSIDLMLFFAANAKKKENDFVVEVVK